MSTVKVKRRHTTGGTPSTVDGELSINSFDKKIFIGNGSTAVEIANQLGYSTIATVGTVTSGTWNASTIATNYGGTGLTSFTSSGLLYASSTSALTTGSLFSVNTGILNSRINVNSTAKGGEVGFRTTESNLSGSAALYVNSDDEGVSATSTSAILSLLGGGDGYPYISMSNHLDTNALNITCGRDGIATTSITGYLNDYDASYQILEVIDDVATPHIYFGSDSNENFIKMNITGSAPWTTEIKTTTLTLNATTVDCGFNTLLEPTLKYYNEVTASPTISSNTLTLDLSTAQVFTVSLNANITTLTISNTPATANRSIGFTLIFTADGTARTVTWGSAIKWANNDPPALTSTNGKKDILSFISPDNGTNWYGFIGGLNF